jgi:hypothetical protein
MQVVERACKDRSVFRTFLQPMDIFKLAMSIVIGGRCLGFWLRFLWASNLRTAFARHEVADGVEWGADLSVWSTLPRLEFLHPFQFSEQDAFRLTHLPHSCSSKGGGSVALRGHLRFCLIMQMHEHARPTCWRIRGRSFQSNVLSCRYFSDEDKSPYLNSPDFWQAQTFHLQK